MENNIKVTIVLRTYKRAEFLRQSLRSVELQTSNDWELIIFDDEGSAENLSIISKFKKKHKNKRIVYITTQTAFDLFKKSWVYMSDLSEGDVIVRLDDDDLLARDCVEYIKYIYKKYPDLDFSYGSSAVFNDKNLIRIVKGVTPLELPKTTCAWIPYTIENNSPWDQPGVYQDDYYDVPQSYTSIIHASKLNQLCVYHTYAVRTKSLKDVKDKINIKSEFVDDLEFMGTLEYLGLKHASIKKVLTYVREHNEDRVTQNDEIVSNIDFVRYDVDHLRPNNFKTNVLNLSIEDKNILYINDKLISDFLLVYTYSKNISDTMPLKKNYEKSFVYLVTENYIDIVTSSAKSIREFSDIPILIYLVNSDKIIDLPNTKTIRWDIPAYDVEDSMYHMNGDNFYIDRANKKIYNILIQRIKVINHALKNFSKNVAYIDSDSVATPYVDRIFDMYDENSTYPYFVEGIYDYLHSNGRGGAISKDDLSTTLEAPACDLFNVNQYVRERYRQTGYFVAGQNTYDFLNEWFEFCMHPKIMDNIEYYAPYNEETILNVLLYKYNIQNGLPYLYVNGTLDTVDEVYSKVEFKGANVQNHIRKWLRVPENKETILFFHGEKNPKIMDEMVKKIKNNTNKINLLFLAPHLSTGGMPAYVLKRIETLQKYSDKFDIYVVEYSLYSDSYVVQRNKIKEILPKDRFFTLGDVNHNKSELINILKNNYIDILHVDEILEGFDSFNKMNENLLDQIYDNNRTWKVVETCHNVWFEYEKSKKYNPDAYAFCTPYHPTVQFASSPSYYDVFEYPIEDKSPSKELKEKTKNELGLKPNKKHILNVGLWTSGKNQGEGVEIARKLQKTNPELHFHFIGNQAPNFEDYWGPIMKNLPSNVTVWGERDDVDKFMIACDLFMFNSTWECNPLVLREAISYGLKIVSRDLPQYMDMFKGYINVLGSNIDTNKEVILNTLKKDRDYVIPKSQEKEFALKFDSFYEKIYNTPIIKQKKMNKDISITQHYVNNPHLEINGKDENKNYLVKFFDENGVCVYDNTIRINSWVKLNRQYYTRWNAKVWEDGELIYDNTLNYENKRVYISFDSSSLGDSIAWIPYCLEFKRKHNCHVVVSTFWNTLFEKTYPELEFVLPGTVVNNLYGMYKLGWFYNPDREPVLPSTIPLQKTATNILGLDYEEIIPEISYTVKERPFETKYVTIATNSTAGLKFWQKEEWEKVIDYLVSNGYKVVNVSREKNPMKNVIELTDTSMENTMNVIHHSEFFIGLSSGLSWLAWALKKQVIMIANFTTPDHEFQKNCIRIINQSVCNGCWNNPEFKFDKGDWDWCPVHKNTDRQFECHKSIKAEIVIEKIKTLL